MVTILDDKGHFCGGALIASKYVVTAGHCLVSDGDTHFQVRSDLQLCEAQSGVQVRLGEHNLKMTGETILPEKNFTVVRSFRHKDYDSKKAINDIALLELGEEVDLKVYTPVCLPSKGDGGEFIGKRAWIYGNVNHWL